MTDRCTSCGRRFDIRDGKAIVEYIIAPSDHTTRIQRQRRTGRQWCSSECETDTIEDERDRDREHRLRQR